MTVAAETAQGKVASVGQPAAAGGALTALAAAIASAVETQKALKTQATSETSQHRNLNSQDSAICRKALVVPSQQALNKNNLHNLQPSQRSA